MTPDPLDDPELPALVSAAMEMRDSGIEPPLEEICSARPDLVEAVALAIETSRQLPSLQRASATHDGFVGRVLDSRYRLVARLGAGAMGVVYRGEDLELQRDVAVKILRAALLDGDEAEYRFTREAEALAAIHHGSVVTVYDRGRTGDDDPYLVMELLEGEPLSRLLEEGKRRGATNQSQDTSWIARALGVESLEEPSYLRTAVRWTADLASGLGAAHAKGIFHRDVKPSNVWVRGDGNPVLLDFGIAAQVSHATITREGMALGTPAYMAPESLSEKSRPDAALDVYGLSATLYHMLTLRPPYAGTPSQILSSLVTKEPPPAQRLRPGLPRDLQAILDRGMARHPSDRYASAAELEADLRAFLDYRPVTARHLSPVTRVWRRLRRSPAFIAGASVAVLAIGAVLGVQARSAWLDGRREAHHEVWRHLPPNLGVVEPDSRAFSEAEGRAEVEALLDEAAELSVEALPTFLIRAAFRLDHGNARGAAADMAHIADSLGSSYARELAKRYAALPADSASALDLDTADLPEPGDALDVYLAAFHMAREGRRAEAMSLLEDERLVDYGPAQELLLLGMRNDPHRMYERAIALEEQVISPTATTAHRLSYALGLLKNYPKALEASRAGLELAPRSHTLRINAGWVAWRAGFIDEARAHLTAAIALKPGYLLSHVDLVRVLMDAGELEEARSVVASAPFGKDDASTRTRLILEGDIETERTLIHREAGETEDSIAAARAALDKFAQAGLYGEPVTSARAAISAGILDGDDRSVFQGLAALLEREPTNVRRIAIFLRWMPEDPNDDDTAAIGRFLEALRAELTARGESDAIPTPQSDR